MLVERVGLVVGYYCWCVWFLYVEVVVIGCVE